jgi:hypothetical protein
MSTTLVLAQNTGNGVFVFGGALFLVFLIIAILASIFWIWMLIDVLTSSMPVPEKVLWFLVVFFLHLVGAIIYFIVRRQGRGTAMST